MTINGVPGPNQNNQHAVPTPISQALQKITPSKYGTHTSEDSTVNTRTNITAVLQSLILKNTQYQGKAIRYQHHIQNLFPLEGSMRMRAFQANWRLLYSSSTLFFFFVFFIWQTFIHSFISYEFGSVI